MSASSFKTLVTHRPKGVVVVQRAYRDRSVSAQSPALEVMTDFARMQSVTISPEAGLFAANETMVARGVRLLLVVDEQQALLGIVSTSDTLGERPMQLLHQGKGTLFELTVVDLMHPIGEIDMLEFNAVRHASVGDIVATLKALGRQHLLVSTVDSATGRQQMRGMFSATQIGRQLGVEVQPLELARTFAEVEAALVS